ncbi:MAG TPA: hypothetical protein VM261_23405 [Kofleriaceae bacterium]|nr:hypothetical protein [Kofleriaceae bacterium]
MELMFCGVPMTAGLAEARDFDVVARSVALDIADASGHLGAGGVRRDQGVLLR